MPRNQVPTEVAIRPSGEVTTNLIINQAHASWWLTKGATDEAPTDFEVVVRGAGPNIKDELNEAAHHYNLNIRWE